MWALALLMEMGPHKDREKLWPGWELNPRPSGLIIAALPTELQSQTGAGRVKGRAKVTVMNMYKYKDTARRD